MARAAVRAPRVEAFGGTETPSLRTEGGTATRSMNEHPTRNKESRQLSPCRQGLNPRDRITS